MAEFRPVPKSDHLFSELVVRLIAIGPDGKLFVFGTAFIIQPWLALTAKHVVQEYLKLDPGIYQGKEVNFNFWAIQVVWDGTEHNYIVWEVNHVSLSGHSDLAILKLHPYCQNAATYTQWKIVPCTLIPPKVGDSMIGFGLHSFSFEGSRINAEGKVEHIEMKSEASSSRGTVTAVYAEYRDRSMLTFPCFEIEERFDPGMSGGLVINQNSEVCGIICSSLAATDESSTPTSYAAMLWPMMAMKIDFDLFRSSPIKGTKYLLEFARSSNFKPNGWDQIVIEDNPVGPGCHVLMTGLTDNAKRS